MDFQRSKWHTSKFVQHKIELDTSIQPTHQTRHKLNPNYVAAIKHDIDKLLVVSFIQWTKETIWLSPMMIVPKKIGKFKNCIDFRKLNEATKKNPYLLPFSNEILNIVIGYEAYRFLDGYSGYHQIFIAPKDKYKTTFVTNWGAYVWMVMPFGVKNGPSTFQKTISKTFKEYLD